MATFTYIAKSKEGVVSNNIEAETKAEALKKAKAMHPGAKVTLQ